MKFFGSDIRKGYEFSRRGHLVSRDITVSGFLGPDRTPTEGERPEVGYLGGAIWAIVNLRAHVTFYRCGQWIGFGPDVARSFQVAVEPRSQNYKYKADIASLWSDREHLRPLLAFKRVCIYV